MKTKYLFLAASMPLVLAACSDEQYLDQASTVVGRDGLGTLIEAPTLAGGVTGAETKAFGTNGGWTWIPGVGNENKVVTVDSIGLCWTGVGSNTYAGPLTETGDNVYTNNLFEHAGWLTDGATAPTFHCGVLNNGAYHNYFEELLPRATYDNGTWTSTNGTLDMAKGLFKSASATIYSGEYIVYTPYNRGFWNAPVTAIQPREMTLTVTEKDGESAVNSTELMTKYAFSVGHISNIEGGDEVNSFSTKMLSTGLHLNLTGTKKLKEIVLWTKGEKGIILEQQLSAKEIKAQQGNANLTTGIYLTGVDAQKAVSSMIVKLGESGLKLGTTAIDFYIPMLPYGKEFKDLNIMLVEMENDGSAGKTAIVHKTPTLTPGQPSAMTLNVDDNVAQNGSVVGTFTQLNYAYDNDSFWEAYGNASSAGENASVDAKTVSLLDDITLTDNADNKYYNGDVDDNRNRVYVKPAEGETATLTLGGNSNGTYKEWLNGRAYRYGFEKTTFGVDVMNNPWGCCEAGRIELSLVDVDTENGTSLTMTGSTMYIGGKTDFRGNVYSLAEVTDEEQTSHVGENGRVPTIFLTQKAVVSAYADFTNEGTMTIPCKGETANDGDHATFNMKSGHFVNAVVTGNSGETYRASVTVDGNGNSGEDGVFNISNTGSVKTVVDNYGDIKNKGNIDNDRGAFNNKAGGTFTDYVGSSLSGSRIENEDETSEFICEVNSEMRYNNAIDLTGIRPTTILRFVYGEKVNIGTGTFVTTYTLRPNKESGIYAPYAKVENQLIRFESAIDNVYNGKLQTLTLNGYSDESGVVATTIGDLTVKSGKITIDHSNLTIDGNYTATSGALNTNLPQGIVEITGDMNLSSKAYEENGLTSTGNIRLAEKKSLTVDGDINVIAVAGEVQFENGTAVKAKNMTVNEENEVVFSKNNVTYLGTANNMATGKITNNGRVDIVNAVSGSDVAAKVWCNTRDGSGVYLNNSMPQYY